MNFLDSSYSATTNSYQRNMKATILVILSFLHVVLSVILPPEIFTNSRIRCTLELQNASPESNILIAYSSDTRVETNSLITELLSNDLTVEIMNINEDDSIKFIQVPQKFFMHILILSSVKEYEELLKKLYRTAIWNAPGKYILVCMAVCDLQEIFQLSWARYVVNIDVVTLDNDEETQVYTYFPYGRGKCGNNIQVEVLGKCSSVSEPFPEKIPQDLHGCNIRAFINIYPPFGINNLVYNDSANLAGRDVVILNNLVQKTNMNRTSVAEKGAFAHIDPQGKYEGALHYLSEDICDIALGSLFPNVSFFGDFDVTFFYSYVNFAWVVPVAQPGKQWASIVLIFSKTLWLAILVILVCNIAIWWIFARGTIDKNQYKELSICMLNAWYSLLQGGISLPHSFTMRLLIIFWTLFALLLATLYQSQLVSILLTPVYEHQVANTRELAESSIDIVFKNDFLVRLSHSDKPVDREIVKKGRKLTTVEHALFSKIVKNKQAFLGNVPATLYMIPRNFSLPSGKPDVYMFKDAEFGNPITMFIKKGYPLLKRFDELMVRFLESGFIGRWMEEATFYIPKIEGDNGPKKLQVSHLTGAFFVLMIGMNGALLILVVEIIIHRCQERNKHRNW